MKKRIDRLVGALSFLKNGKGIYLEDDVFLTGELLDGSDKIYGFIRVGKNDLRVVSREGSHDGWNIRDIDEADLRYIFALSAPNIFKKIERKEYPIVNADEV